MTAGLWHQTQEFLGEGARDARPAVSVAWPAGPGRAGQALWLDLYESEEGRCAVLHPAGVQDAEALAALGRAVVQAAAWGSRRVTVDFSAVPHLDYRAVPGLVSRLDAVEQGGAACFLIGLSRYLGQIFRVAGVAVEELPGGTAGAECGAATAAGDPSGSRPRELTSRSGWSAAGGTSE